MSQERIKRAVEELLRFAESTLKDSAKVRPSIAMHANKVRMVCEAYLALTSSPQSEAMAESESAAVGCPCDDGEQLQ